MNKSQLLEQFEKWDLGKLQQMYKQEIRSSIIVESRRDIAISRGFWRNIQELTIWRWNYEYGQYIESSDKIEVDKDTFTCDSGDISVLPFENKFITQIYNRKDSVYLHNPSGKIEQELTFFENVPESDVFVHDVSIIGDYIYFHNADYDAEDENGNFSFQFYHVETKEEKWIQLSKAEISKIEAKFDIKLVCPGLYTTGKFAHVAMLIDEDEEKPSDSETPEEFHFLFDQEGNFMYNLEQFFCDPEKEMFDCQCYVGDFQIVTTSETGYRIYDILPKRLQLNKTVFKSDAAQFPFLNKHHQGGQVVNMDGSMFRTLHNEENKFRYKIYLQAPDDSVSLIQEFNFDIRFFLFLGTSNKDFIYKACVDHLLTLGPCLARLVGDYV